MVKDVFTENGLTGNSFRSIEKDFDKIKKLVNANKYLLIMGVSEKSKLNLDLFEDQIDALIDKRKLRNYKMQIIAQKSFKTYEDQYFLSIIIKIV